MATLYVENIPDELYEALRKRARRTRKSIAVEVLTLLEPNSPTEPELPSDPYSDRRGLRDSEESLLGPARCR